MSEFINAFPSYHYYIDGKGEIHNVYRDVELGKGGWVYAKPGIHSNIALLDAASLHPMSIIALNKLGKYTQRYKDLRQARVYIKHGEYDKAGELFDGKLKKYLGDRSTADSLSAALKLPLNSFFGLSFATFSNPARDSRDINNIIALRGALFMKTLFDEVEARGFKVIAIRTDSIKIANANLEIIQFVQEFGKKYGYEMEHEATYERICLIDNAQYVATLLDPSECEKQYGYVPSDNAKHFRKHSHPWTVTGKMYMRPFIFKTLFTGEPVTFDDLCETNTVKDAAIYLDMNETLPNVANYEKELSRRKNNETHPDKLMKLNPDLEDYSDEDLEKEIAKGHNYCFVGRVGRFYPIKPGAGGGWQLVYRRGKYDYVSGSKGIRWLQAEGVKQLGKEDDIDPRYHQAEIDKALKAMEQFGSYERFVDLSKPYEPEPKQDDTPWTIVPCGDGKYNTCMECPECKGDVCKRGYALAVNKE